MGWTFPRVVWWLVQIGRGVVIFTKAFMRIPVLYAAETMKSIEAVLIFGIPNTITGKSLMQLV
jgi:uncharacterized ferredoxin-like protein